MTFPRLANVIEPAFLPSLAGVLCCLLALDAAAAPRHGELVSSLTELFPRQAAPGVILAAARRLFWMLATMSLVWNFGMLLLRRADLGEVFLELLRFTLFTGLFYWLLSGASTADGFVYAIFDSFKLMSGVSDAATRGDHLIQIGLDIFYKILEQSQNWKEADVLVACGLSIATLVALTLLAAQIVLIVVMAWMLAYAGIFLLGMGGARWTSPIAIGFYKHVLALGSALLVLALLLRLGQGFLQGKAWHVLAEGSDPRGLDYASLADMFVVSLLMSVLGIKLPGLIYTLVTGSPLGLLAGTAGMTASAMATGGGHLYSTAASAFHPASKEYRDACDPAPAQRGPAGGGMAAQAIYRAAGMAQTEEPVFEPFGQRPQTGMGTVFSQPSGASAWVDARMATRARAAAERSSDASMAGSRSVSPSPSPSTSTSTSAATASTSSELRQAVTPTPAMAASGTIGMPAQQVHMAAASPVDRGMQGDRVSGIAASQTQTIRAPSPDQSTHGTAGAVHTREETTSGMGGVLHDKPVHTLSTSQRDTLSDEAVRVPASIHQDLPGARPGTDIARLVNIDTGASPQASPGALLLHAGSRDTESASRNDDGHRENIAPMASHVLTSLSMSHPSRLTGPLASDAQLDALYRVSSPGFSNGAVPMDGMESEPDLATRHPVSPAYGFLPDEPPSEDEVAAFRDRRRDGGDA